MTSVYLFSAAGQIAEFGGASGLRPSQTSPFEEGRGQCFFSFGCLVLFVEGMETEDKWKVVDYWADRSSASYPVSDLASHLTSQSWQNTTQHIAGLIKVSDDGCHRKHGQLLSK